MYKMYENVIIQTGSVKVALFFHFDKYLNILIFQSFHFSYVNDDGSNGSLSKICGFTLDNAMTSGQVTTENFRELLLAALRNEDMSIGLDQSRKITSNSTGIEVVKRIRMQLRNRLLTKRYISKSILVTLPYGFCDEQYLKTYQNVPV